VLLPDWASTVPDDAPWWSPARLVSHLQSGRILPHDVLPRLTGIGWDGGDPFTDGVLDPTVEEPVAAHPTAPQAIPVATDRRWLRVLAELTGGDRSRTLLQLADPRQWSAIRELSSRLGEVIPYIVTASVEPWPPSSWMSHGTAVFSNGGLLTPVSLLDLVEVHAHSGQNRLPASQTFAVFLARQVDGEQRLTVVACYWPGHPGETGDRDAVATLLTDWATRGRISAVDPPGELHGMVNKSFRYSHRDVPIWGDEAPWPPSSPNQHKRRDGYSKAMSIWDKHDLENKIVAILEQVKPTEPGAKSHHFGKPFLSAYQIAIAMQRAHPETVAAIGKPIGGSGTGQQDSLAQYLSHQLSQRIKRMGGDYPIEGAFFANADALEIAFRGVDGSPLSSSLVGTGFHMALYRIREDY